MIILKLKKNNNIHYDYVETNIEKRIVVYDYNGLEPIKLADYECLDVFSEDLIQCKHCKKFFNQANIKKRNVFNFKMLKTPCCQKIIFI